MLQRGDERELDRLARDGDLGRIAVGDEEPVGIGWIHVTSGSVFRFDTIGSRAGPRSIGRARRSRPSSMSRHTLVAIR